MRNGQNGRRRGRGPNNRPAPGGNRSLDTSRQDARARGNAQQLLEKYKNMARDAASSGDRILSEYYMQHADHYFRVLADYRARYEDHRPRERGVGELDEGDFEEDGGEEGFEAQPQQRVNGRSNDEERRARDPRDDRPRDERPRDERPRDDRPRDERYDRARQDDRPERPRDDRVRDDRVRDERPREDRVRDDRPRNERVRADEWPREDRLQDETFANDGVRDERPRQDRQHSYEARGETRPPRSRDSEQTPAEARAGSARRAAAEPEANVGFDETPRFMRRPEELAAATPPASAELPLIQADVAAPDAEEAPVRRRRGRPRNSERVQAQAPAAEEVPDAG